MMHKRSLFRRLFSSLAAVLFGQSATVAEPSYLFDWTKDPPCTDDPRYAGILRYGKHNRVYLDGVDTGDALRFRTGKDGYIERPGNRILRGHVRYVDLREGKG